MAKCYHCKQKIKYNKFKIVEGKPYCIECAFKMLYVTERIQTPPEHVDEILRDLGISILGD